MGWKFMSTQATFLHRYVLPFMAGVCMAGATVGTDSFPAIVLLLCGLGLAFASLPAGARMIARLAGSQH
jgi:hypothetical protein